MLWHRTHVFSFHAFKVFEAVIAWVNHDKDVRQEFMARLMEHVRLPLLPREYLVQVSARPSHGGACSVCRPGSMLSPFTPWAGLQTADLWGIGKRTG